MAVSFVRIGLVLVFDLVVLFVRAFLVIADTGLVLGESIDFIPFLLYFLAAYCLVCPTFSFRLRVPADFICSVIVNSSNVRFKPFRFYIRKKAKLAIVISFSSN